MCDFENQSGLGLYQEINLAVVEVRHGESQEEAWRRYLAENPERARVDIKIFHYPGQVFTHQKEKGTQPQIERQKL